MRAEQLGVVNWTRWLGELDIGFELERESGGGSLTGPSLAWEVPVFNQHQDDICAPIPNYKSRSTRCVDCHGRRQYVRLAYQKVVNARARVAQYKEVMIPQRIETWHRPNRN